MKNIVFPIVEISLLVSPAVLLFLVLGPVLQRRYDAKWVYGIWIVLALRLAAPFQLKLPYRQIEVSIPAELTAPAISEVQTGIPITLPQGRNLERITLLDGMAALWLAGSVMFLAANVFSLWFYRRQIRKKGKRIEKGPVLHQMACLTRELKLRRRIPVVKYEEAASPMIVGIVHPILVLPENEYSYEELYFILKHELIHYKRCDVLFKLLFVTANALHWFNPLVYLMRKEAFAAMELACDERVVQGSEYAFRKAYTETLLSTLPQKQNRKTMLSTQFTGGTQMMKKRFWHILIRTGKRSGIPVLVCAILLTAALGTLAGCSMEELNGADVSNPAVGEGAPEGIGQASTPEGAGDGMEASAPHAPALTPVPEADREDIAVSELIDLLEQELSRLEAGETLPEQEPGAGREDIAVSELKDMLEQELSRLEAGEMPQEQELEALRAALKQVQDRQQGELNELPGNSISADAIEIKDLAEALAASYFTGDAKGVKALLPTSYEGVIDVYQGSEAITDLTLKGLEGIEDEALGSEAEVSLEHREGNADYFRYLTINLTKKEEGWEIQAYGLEQ